MTDLFGDEPVKRCIDCKQLLPLSVFYLQLNTNGRRYHCSYCRPCAARRARQQKKTAEGKARYKAATRKRKYGLTQQQYDALLASQGGVCAVCGQPETATRAGVVLPLAVDHNHSPPYKHRGLLCGRCNAGIGFFLDDPARLRAAADYLEAHQS